MVRPLSVSSPLVLQTIAWMRKHGFSPVPVHHASKAAISRDYVRIPYEPPDDDTWRAKQLNVGIVTGPVARGPVDIDLDCEEALFFAPRFLPPTPAVFGRASKPRSHFLYRLDCTSFDKAAFTDPATRSSTIIEMRADGGHQTVMPGSVHESGETIEWSDLPFPDIPTMSPDSLSRAVRKVAIATLIVRYMWTTGFHHKPTLCLSGALFYLGWTVDETVELIQAVMDYSSDDDRSRIATVRTTFKRGEADKKIQGAGTLRKEVGNDVVVDRFLEWAGSPTINMLQEYNDRFAVVSLSGRFRIADLDVPPGEPPVFHLRDDFLAFRETDTVEIEEKKVPKARLWLANPRRRQYRKADFLPGQEGDGDVLNTWTGWAVLPSSDGSCAAWLELMREVVCSNSDEARWLEHWFAGIFREPMVKPGTAPVLIGIQGAGKSMLLTYIGRILGRGYMSVTNEKHVHGNFNQHLATTLLIHSEEALHGGDKKHRGIIKSLITDETLPIEAKGIDVQVARSFHRLILTSNDDLAAPAEVGDRRYTVIDVRKAKRKIDDDLISRLLDEMDGTGPAALHHHFLTMDWDRRTARTNLKTESLGDMKSLNLEPVDAWWHSVLESGTLLPDYLRWSSKDMNVDWPSIVGTPALYCAMVLSLRDRGSRYITSEISFYLKLSSLIGLPFTKQKRNFINPQLDGIPQMARSLSDRQQAILNFPSLADCRTAFETRVGQPIEWPGDLPDEERGAHERF